MNIREFVVKLEEYFGKWSSALVLESFVREAIKYNDEDRAHLFVLIIKTRPVKWGPPDLCSLLSILENDQVGKTIGVRENHEEEKCPVCSSPLRKGCCRNCTYSLGDDIEEHRLWWEKRISGEYPDLHFDCEKIMKKNMSPWG
jgi:hypothetical protein